jgi:dTDP-4-amino-4,6-dideoxygalactose transaminase
MSIPKKMRDPNAFTLPFRYFPRGRDAFEHVLRSPAAEGRTVLLPAYIGWGAVEGSGVFDPVVASRLSYAFYPMKGKLTIDVPALTGLLEANPGAVLLLIHYFGFKDPNLARVKKLARARGCVIVDDFAHGLFTFFREPIVDFDFGIFSLHKMLPYRNLSGGLLLAREGEEGGKDYTGLYRYNLEAIARVRRANYEIVLERLRRVNPPGVTILRESLGESVPESFPILLRNRSVRNAVHARLNEQGFGLISLYHQLIAEVGADYRAERGIADRITNLPVHQDAEPAEVRRMVDALERLLRSGDFDV